MLIQGKNEAMISGKNLRVRNLKAEINELLDKEAQMWSQRSYVLWLWNGDNNTKFFHSRATKRFRKKVIREIMDNTNTWKDKPEEVVATLLSYYQELFSTATPVSSNETLIYIP